MASLRCPVCASPDFESRFAAPEISREAALRDRFVRQRFDGRPQPFELKDLTAFAHGIPARLVACSHCGLLLREEGCAIEYGQDRYDLDLLNHLYPRYVDAFRRKEGAYRGLLPSRADVLELGSHLGGFLEVAESWNWNPIGLDVGWQTSQFARHKGFKVHRSTLEDSALASSSADAIFIWNCFEQIEDPKPTLRAANRLLKDTGLLVIRVPNAAFYQHYRRHMQRWNGRPRVRIILEHSNLLAFPYLYGYSARHLLDLVCGAGFEATVQHNAALITIPFPEMTRKLKKETADVERWVAQRSLRKHGSLDGPWIEMVFRRRET